MNTFKPFARPEACSQVRAWQQLPDNIKRDRQIQLCGGCDWRKFL